MKDNNYELYRNIKSLEQYFNGWTKDSSEILTDELKQAIYKRYVIKAFVFQRDNFKCKNEGCKTPGDPLTLHHIKFQKNGGKDSVKNCAAICYTCHQYFNKGRIGLTFDGATYKMHKSNDIDWKVIKKQNRVLRKKVMQELESIKISVELFEQLMRFLMINFDDMEEDD